MFKKMRNEWKKLKEMLSAIAFLILCGLCLNIASLGSWAGIATQSKAIVLFSMIGSVVVLIAGSWSIYLIGRDGDKK